MAKDEDAMKQVVRGVERFEHQDCCPTCGRGAAGLAIPNEDDLNAMIDIQESFNKHRRDFSPDMQRKIDSFKKVVSYIHRLIAGSR